MIRILFISVLLLLVLDARENPFFPSGGEKDIPISSNENRSKEPLKRAAIALPAQARILQKVTLEYKNLDGTVENKSIELDNSVDWHLPVFVSQNYSEISKTAQSEDKHDKNEVKQKDSTYKTIASVKDLSLLSSGKSLKVVTTDEVLRNFLLVHPHRIVIDLKKDEDVKSYVKKDSQNIFKEVRIGNHEGYYRVVVELDGYYRYDFKKVSDGYLIELK
ncbi:MAG: AMIN domain-containing protein [Sulfurimonas sp.]|uniref:AMIN domain-containing protein n=1 Tax=Sulfurimonas sp. TaxID=2022749 RepID=UPI00260F27BF|nr:AMIN domain-containing protein [Sulfurimonas sp.]MDD5401143.1 AMIN domain-containing protein [Sulfurimonas sp.]